MRYMCVIEANDYSSKLEAMAQAARDESKWKKVVVPDLINKCGSCEHFRPYCNSSNGGCAKGHVWGPRSRPACKAYERKKG